MTKNHTHRHLSGRFAATMAALLVCVSTAYALGDETFHGLHGANYVPSYAATSVETWLHYDPQIIERELGYARQMKLNCIRVFLQSLVYHHNPQRFLDDFEDFLARADRHGLQVMPILFDSCFGVAPSLESRHIWVANPGPDRMAPEWWPQSDAYLKAVISSHADDKRILLWDVMNEPTATHLANTAVGKQQIDAFVARACQLVKQFDNKHPITVGVATWDNRDVIRLVDVLSCHSYGRGVEAFRNDLQRTRDQAAAAGKPWIVTECCNPAAGSTYEMALPVLREFGVGHTVWQLIIGRDQFRSASGLVYPDGTVRRIAEVEAVMNSRATGFEEKPDDQGLPHRHDIPLLLAEYLEASVRDGVTDVTWRERVTLVESLLARPGAFGAEGETARAEVVRARSLKAAGKQADAYPVIAALIGQAADELKRNPPRAAPADSPRATVYRDVYGIPHIWADNEEAAAYAIAQAQCEDLGMQVFENLRPGWAAVPKYAEKPRCKPTRIMHLVARSRDGGTDLARESRTHAAIPAGVLSRAQ